MVAAAVEAAKVVAAVVEEAEVAAAVVEDAEVVAAVVEEAEVVAAAVGGAVVEVAVAVVVASVVVLAVGESLDARKPSLAHSTQIPHAFGLWQRSPHQRPQFDLHENGYQAMFGTNRCMS